MTPSEDAGANGIVGCDLVVGVVVTVDDELSGLGKQAVAVFTEVP